MALNRIYVTRRPPEEIRRRLEAAGSVSVWDKEYPVARDVLLAEVRDADALLCLGDDNIDRAIIEAGRRLRVISTASAGIDHIDLDAAQQHGIIVCNTPGAADAAVADLTMALVLACARHIIDGDLFVRAREWRYWYPDLLLGEDLRGSTLGIVGLGLIGLQVAHRAAGFSMRVIYTDIRRDPAAEESLRVQFGALHDLLREADFVSLHVPLSPATHDLIGARELRLMKPTAYLINTARGQLVEHDALVQALRDGWIAGAGLDVFQEEPLPEDDPLLRLPNVILTPHIGANTGRSMQAMFQMAAEQIIQALQGRRPAHTVVVPLRGEQAA